MHKRKRWGLRIVLLSALTGIVALVAWAQMAKHEYAAGLEELRKENDALREQVATQRELLREQTLKNTRRSPDEFLALFPAKYPQGNYDRADTRFEDCWFVSSDGLRLHGWYLRHPKPRAAVLHIHGNAGNLSHRASVAELLHDRFGVSVLLFDYRGYGRSEGVPTILGLLRDARAARAQLAILEGINTTDVVLLGESIGGAVAVDLAAEDGARGLILENTFSSLRDVAGVHYPKFLVSLMVADKLNSAANIARYHGPLLQVHGDADQIVPLASARKLFDVATEPKRFVELPGHDHNDPLPVPYYQALDKFFHDLPAKN